VEELVQNSKKSLVCLVGILATLVCFSDTAQAQNGTLALTANPTQLTFSAQSGTISPQSILITSSAGSTNVAVSATSANNWLQVTPTSGTTPLQVTVSVNPALSALATDDGFINIVATGASVSVRAELDTLPGASPLSANPNSLSFPFSVTSTVPASRSVTLSSSTGLTTFTATARTADGGNWLTVNPISGNISGGLQVTVNPTALPATPGPFSGAVAINAPGTNGVSLPVLVTLAGTPAIQLGATQLAFAWQVGTNGPAAQSFSITSSTGANVGFTAFSKTASCGSWLVISPDNGATPSNITAQVNTAGLTTGTTTEPCAGEIDITAAGASNSLVVIPVTLLVSTNPLLLVPATGPTFTYQLGTSIEPAAQNVQITSSGTPLAFTVTTAPITPGGVDFVTVTPTTGATPQSLAISVTPSVLATVAPGTYTDTVTLTSAGAGNSPQSFVVTLTVNSNPLLTASAQSLTFNYEIGKTAPTNQPFTVMSTASPLNFQVAVDTSNCSGFLSASASNGNNGLTYQDESQVVASVNVAGLTTPQVCNGHITLSVPGSSTPALSIPVTLNVSDKALLDVSTDYIYITALTGAGPSSQTVSVTSTDSTVLAFTAVAATNPIGLTWLSVAPNSGDTPLNLLVGINPANLGVGGYDGTVTVSSGGLPSQVIHVHLQVVASNVSAAPPSVSLTQSAGGTAATQTIQISGVPAGTTIGALATTFPAGGTWLQATASGTTVTVTAGGPNLLPNLYSGVVTVIVPGAGGSPLYIPVNLTVSAANTLAVSVGTVNFGYQIGSNVLQGPALVQVTSTGAAGVPITATYTPTTGGNIVTVTPTSGNTPLTLSIALNTAILPTLGAGTYSGNVVVTSPNIPGGGAQMIKVNLTVSGPSAPTVTSIVNGASFLPGAVSPGELVSIFGSNLGPSTGINFTPTNNTVGTTLGNTTVTFNGVLAPLTYAGPLQINAIVPYEIGNVPLGESINVVVSNDGIVSASFMVVVTNTAPGIFSANQTGAGQAAILNSNDTPNGSTNPAARGTTVSIYATGEGVLVPPAATGSMSGPSLPLPVPAANVSVTIGGQPATISYAGEAPTLVSGVLQVNVAIPTDINPGNQLVVLTIGNNSNKLQPITVAVK
jgi:uncharacterized protein (TIGR03437 family)